MLDLLAIGDIKLDTFVVLNDASVQCQLKMPECQLCMEHGGKVLVDVVDSQIAGSAPNVAVGLARMGMKTGVLSNMGLDGTKDLALKKLKKEGVATNNIRSVRGAKSAFSIVLNFKGERTILTDHNQNSYKLPEKLSCKWIYVGEMGSKYESLYRALLKKKKASHKLKIVTNPGTAQIKERKKAFLDLLKHIDILFINREEARALTKTKSGEILTIAKSLFKRGVRHAVITDGQDGAYSFDGEELLFSPMFPGPRIEATGAGDAFAAGYLGALMHGGDRKEALAWGAVNSASAVYHVGPQKGLLSRRQIKQRLKKRSSYKIKTL